MLWGLGANLPIPDGESKFGYQTMNERITSFSWAKEIAPGIGLLAYSNDGGQVVIMGVQFFYKSLEVEGSTTDEAGWEIFEVDRFDARGPHDVS